jgi:hypothetical protein
MSVLNFLLPPLEATVLEEITTKKFPQVGITEYRNEYSNRIQLVLEVPPEGVPVPVILKQILDLPEIIRGERES